MFETHLSSSLSRFFSLSFENQIPTLWSKYTVLVQHIIPCRCQWHGTKQLKKGNPFFFFFNSTFFFSFYLSIHPSPLPLPFPFKSHILLSSPFLSIPSFIYIHIKSRTLFFPPILNPLHQNSIPLSSFLFPFFPSPFLSLSTFSFSSSFFLLPL